MPTVPVSDRHAAPGDCDVLLTIGEVARRSGLSASALRFYDREGVLVPTDVDALTGYRRYAVTQVRAARLLASLRRVGMPLAEAALVLEEDARGAGGVAADVVAAHEQRLVDGLADARREIASTLALLAEQDGDAATVRARVCVGRLLEALRAVRFAVAPGQPVAGAPDGRDLRVLTGILLEVTGTELRCVATDRYRLAVGWAPLQGPGTTEDVRATAVVPAEWADLVAETCISQAEGTVVELAVDAHGVGLRFGEEVLATRVVPGSFPDYRAIVGPQPRGGGADAGQLSSRLPVGAESVGLLLRDGSVHLAPVGADPGTAAPDVFVDPEFLGEALAAAGPRPVLVVDGPRRPLAIRGDGCGFSVLMPVAPAGLRP